MNCDTLRNLLSIEESRLEMYQSLLETQRVMPPSPHLDKLMQANEQRVEKARGAIRTLVKQLKDAGC